MLGFGATLGDGHNLEHVIGSIPRFGIVVAGGVGIVVAGGVGIELAEGVGIVVGTGVASSSLDELNSGSDSMSSIGVCGCSNAKGSNSVESLSLPSSSPWVGGCNSVPTWVGDSA